MKKIKLIYIKTFFWIFSTFFLFEIGVILLTITFTEDKSISKLIEVLIIALLVTFISIIISHIISLQESYKNAKETKELICFTIKTDLDILLNPNTKHRSDEDGKTINYLFFSIKNRIKSFGTNNYHEFYFALKKNKDFYSSSMWAASIIDKEHTFGLSLVYFNLLSLLEQYEKIYSVMPPYTITNPLNYQHLNYYIILFIDACIQFDQMKMVDYD